MTPTLSPLRPHHDRGGITIYHGDCRDILPTLPERSVQTCVTSPPYWGLRDYGVAGQIGSEATVEEWVDVMVAVFREVRRVLRDDGTVWLNLGDAYSGSGPSGASYQSETTKRRAGMTSDGNFRISKTLGQRGLTYANKKPVTPQVRDCLQRSMKGRPLVFGNATTIGITAKRCDIPLHDERLPQGVLLRLLGVERVTIKQRDNDFCQVLHTLNGPCYCWIAAPVCFARMDAADLEIVVDHADDLRIVIANHDADPETVFGVARVVGRRAGKDDDTSLTVKETAKPITELIRNGEPIGNPVPFDAPLKRFPDVYLVDQTVPLGDRFDPMPGDGCDFGVAHASHEQITLTLGNCGVEIRSTLVTHLFAPSPFGSLVRYRELYHQAIRQASASQSKQLMGMPWMVARALQEDGWILRSDCIWAKPNPMPESVRDRPTSAHEHIFLLTKQRRYFYDADAVRTPATSETTKKPDGRDTGPGAHGTVHRNGREKGERVDKQRGHGRRHDGFNDRWDAMTKAEQQATGANLRNVWTIATHAFPAAHFATFPPALVEPCIKAGTSEKGCCGACGAPWVRQTERAATDDRHIERNRNVGGRDDGFTRTKASGGLPPVAVETTGWAPTCTCAADTIPCTVLDPFGGAGTTGMVADRLGRDAVLIDLSREYAEMAERRIRGDAPLFANVQVRP